jgi:hypothetical protein
MAVKIFSPAIFGFGHSIYPDVPTKWNLRFLNSTHLSVDRRRYLNVKKSRHVENSSRDAEAVQAMLPAQWNGLLTRRLFAGTANHDYSRHRRLLEPIFSNIFPTWTKTSAQGEIFPRFNITLSVVYSWRAHWTVDRE